MKSLFKRFQIEGIFLVLLLWLALSLVLIKKNTESLPPQSELSFGEIKIHKHLAGAQDLSNQRVKTSNNAPPSQPWASSKRLQDLVKNEKAILYAKNINWPSHEVELIRQMAELSVGDLKALGANVLAKENDQDERQISIYLLTLAGSPARSILANIGQTPIPGLQNLEDPDSVGNSQLQNERSLRATAVEALDRLAIRNPREVYADLQNIVSHQNDDTLKTFARIGLMGISQGKPGKLSRWLKQNVADSAEAHL